MVKFSSPNVEQPAGWMNVLADGYCYVTNQLLSAAKQPYKDGAPSLLLSLSQRTRLFFVNALLFTTVYTMVDRFLRQPTCRIFTRSAHRLRRFADADEELHKGTRFRVPPFREMVKLVGLSAYTSSSWVRLEDHEQVLLLWIWFTLSECYTAIASALSVARRGGGLGRKAIHDVWSHAPFAVVLWNFGTALGTRVASSHYTPLPWTISKYEVFITGILCITMIETARIVRIDYFCTAPRASSSGDLSDSDDSLSTPRAQHTTLADSHSPLKDKRA